MKKSNNKKNKTIFIEDLTKDMDFQIDDRQDVTYLIISYGEVSRKLSLKFKITGSHAKVTILGIIFGFGKKNFVLSTLQDHQKGGSQSDLLIKSVMKDNSVFDYKGMININKNAYKSNAYQKNQNLMLSKNAQVISKPYLEILANDVRCTHGVTISNIDSQSLYYLNSRGLDKNSAKKLLLYGYLNDVLAKIQDVKIIGKVEEKLNNIIYEYLN
jgi:Fe-S cluster assembly protein SufD